jgi:LmbE family N-acetylglucosaminyl deacetylase
MRVLVFAAHPDDEVLGMGGTLALHTSAGDVVRTICMTDGASAQYPDEPEKREIKQGEAKRASAAVGVDDYVHLDLPNIGLREVSHRELNGVVEAQVLEFRPEVIYTIHPDVNADHVALFESVAVAARTRAGTTVERFLTYAASSSVEWTSLPTRPFVPNWYVDISDTVDRKCAAFDEYTTEQRPYPHPRNARALRALAEATGVAVGYDFAEAFVLVRARTGAARLSPQSAVPTGRSSERTGAASTGKPGRKRAARSLPTGR